MKKTLSFLLFIVSITGFSQSTTIDPRSVSVPRYTNQTAITTAIPSPSVGMMVYNNALNQYTYWNGTAWTNFPATSTTNLWTHNTTTNRIVANPGLQNGIEADRFTSQSNFTLASPLFNVIGNGTVFLNWASATHNGKITQESVTGITLAASRINWNYYTDAAPTTAINLFGYSGSTNTFTINSELAVNNFTKLGNEATTTTANVTRSSPAMKTILLTGSLTQGANPETSASLTTTVPHGLNYNKIVDIKVLVNGVGMNGGFLAAEGATQSGLQFSTYTDGNNIYINRNATNSNNIRPAPGATTAVYRILITYIP
jgi:hypothetical protein